MFDHPLVDYVDRGCAVIESRAEIVYFSEAFADLLSSVGRHGLIPVMVTRPDARLTFAARYYLEAAEGLWAIRTDEGLVDLRDGAVYQGAGDLADASVSGSMPALAAPSPAPDAMHLYFSVSVQHTAGDDTVLGEGAEILAGLADERLTAWGVHEPATLRWDRAGYSEAARQGMPDESRFVLAGSDANFHATAAVRRTRAGVEETITGIACVGSAATGLPEVGKRARQSLTTLAETTALPMIAMMSAAPGRADLMADQYRVPVPVPVAAVIGPRAMRNLTADPVMLTQQFTASIVGRKRIPSVLVDFVSAGTAPWLEAQRFAEALGARNIEAALRAGDTSRSLGGDR